MDTDTNSDGHFDLLTAALSESGLDGLADEFGEEDHGSSSALPSQVVAEQPPLAQSTPTPAAAPHVISVRTPGLGHGQVIVTQAAATPHSVKVVQSTDPQGSRTPVTKVIRIPQGQVGSSSLLRTASGTPIITTQTPNGQRIVQRVVTTGAPGSASRIIISHVPNGSGTPQTKSIIMTPQSGVTTPQTSKNIIITPQGAKTVGSTVARKIFVTRNGQTLTPITTSANGHVVLAPQLLQAAAGGERLLLNQANGQIVRVTTSSISTTANVSQTSGTAQIVTAAPSQHTQIIHSPSVGQLQSITLPASDRSPMQIINKTGLTGGKVITASSAPSPAPPPLHHSPSMPVLTNGESGSRSNSPVYGMGNIPTVVSQKLSVGNIGSLSGGGGGGSVSKMQPVTVTSKDISRMWLNEAELRNRGASRQQALQQMAEEVEEEESEELGHAETYAEYMPSKLRIGLKHPDPVVETSSLSSVEPLDVKYRLSIPESTIDSGVLSALQLEAITYASQRHNTILPSGERAGYLIGDGAGVGKGRTVAGVIFENYLLGRKRALWLSVSNDLKVDAERDLRDIGAHKIDVYSLNKFKYAKISSKENNSVKKGVVFATYSSLIGESQSFSKYRTRLKQLLKWCGKDFEGVIVFDECHKAKNLCPTGSTKPTKTGMTVMELQNRLPKARVIYASATGASEPKNMAYMTRLGLWGPGTPFKEFNDFISAVEKRGVGAMELVAMDMKLRGMYIARQLSFKGVTFRIEEIPLDPAFKKIFDDSVELWVEARAMFQKAADLIQAEHRMRKSMWGQFWSAHQRFFKYLCISAKVSHCVAIAREAVKAGKCVVIGLQSTGEARTMELVEEQGADLNDFVSTAKGVFQTLVEKHFPAPNRQKTWDMLGLGDIMQGNNNSSVDSSLKRKRDEAMSLINKRCKTENSSDDNNDSSDSLSDLSDLDSDSSDSESDRDSNPFGGSGSDSDEDPWLKKSKKKKKKSKPPKKKEKTKKKKGSKKVKKTSSDEEDSYCDKALAQVAFMKKSSSYAGFTNNTNGTSGALSSGGNGMEQAFTMKTELLNLVERLGEKLPPNTLDHLIDELGGPDNVAEMTGRKGRVVQNDDGIQYESRSESDVPLEILNLTEKQRFMDGEKDIAIISEAASSGISLQADRRAINQKRRVHLTLELPWSADRAIQQFGRTHRSNQVSAPEYIFLISELAGERRFAATVAKRLESLGALTHGDRRATESRDLSRFNIDNRYGRAALDVVMRSIAYGDPPLVEPPKFYKGNFFKDVKVAVEGVGLLTIDDTTGITSLDKDFQNISKFLNRLLGMPVDLQNALFDYFNQTLSAIILEAKRSGRWDMGILDLGSGQERVKKMETKVFVGNTATNTAKTELSTVQVERGMSWHQAMDIWRRCQTMEEGFYVSLQERNLKRTAILVVIQGKNKKKEKVYSIYRPNTGLQTRAETLEEIKKKYKKVLPDEAERRWEDQYYTSAHVCTHAYWNGNCKKTSLGLPCEIGLRTRQYHVLSGSVLSVWSRVESVLASIPSGHSSKMQIIRLRTDDGQRIVGSLIPQNCVAPLSHVLSQDSARTYTEKHQQSLESAVNGLRASNALSALAANSSIGGSSSSKSINNTFSGNTVAASNSDSMMMTQSAPSENSEPASSSGSSEPVLSMPVFDFL